jgi:hypothetical protein
MTIKAKLRCDLVEDQNYGPDNTKTGEHIVLNAVYSDDPTTENYTFSQATPSATLDMAINNPNVFGAFVKDREYILTFEEAAQ